MATITKGVGIATFYGCNEFLELSGGTNYKGSLESLFDALSSDKIELEIEIAALGESLETGESFEAVGGWLNGSTNYRVIYEIVLRPLTYDMSEYAEIRTGLKELITYKYKYLKVLEYFHSVNPSTIDGYRLFPISIESVEYSSFPNGKEITLTIKHALSNNG